MYKMSDMMRFYTSPVFLRDVDSGSYAYFYV